MNPTTVPPQAVTVARPLPARTVPALALAIVLAVPGCANIKPYVPPSEGHIAKPQVKAEPDKAIPPTSVMGASKRAAEIALLDVGRRSAMRRCSWPRRFPA